MATQTHVSPRPAGWTRRINAKGQVTIPAEIRRRAGLLPHSDVEIIVVDGVAKLQLCAAGASDSGRTERTSE